MVCERIRWIVLSLFTACGLSLTAHAGQLLITNTSNKPITCKIDGYAEPFSILPAVEHRFSPNMAASSGIAKEAVINFVECGKLRTRHMNITATGPDRILILNGQQTRTVNALLYPYIPTLQGNFNALETYIINTYQASNPQVLLNAVFDPNINIYDFATLQQVLGPDGFDIAEVDMSFLGFLVTNKLITSAKISGDPPFQVAQQAATFNGTLYAVPSWLCSDFVFYFGNQGDLSKLTLRQLRALRAAAQWRVLVSDFDGSWTLTSIYLMAYAQKYGYQNLQQAFTMPPDASVIADLNEFAVLCNAADGNPCIDGTYHDGFDGVVEKAFATGQSTFEIGFSERSFFISLYDTVPGTLVLFPVQWTGSNNGTMLFYTDGFVTNSSTCSSGLCPGDTQAFSTLMTSAAMKSYIAFSQDLPPGTPPRHLIVATQPFWNLNSVKNDPLYQQLAQLVTPNSGLFPFPNYFTQQQEQTMATGVCGALKADLPTYACTSSKR